MSGHWMTFVNADARQLLPVLERVAGGSEMLEGSVECAEWMLALTAAPRGDAAGWRVEGRENCYANLYALAIVALLAESAGNANQSSASCPVIPMVRS